jgi:subtilisin family serine protease
LNNLGSNSSRGGGVAGFDINIVKAWEVSKNRQKIRVAVIDTGVDYTHPDLVDQMLVNTAEADGLPGIDDDNNGFVDDIYGYDFANEDGDPKDDHGHGTHCAGIVGASSNDLGIVGVAPNVEILAVKFLNSSMAGTTVDAIEAIDYAIRRKVDVMSNSWGGEGIVDQALEEAVQEAHRSGIVFVAASGNAGKDNDSILMVPANYDNVIAVGSFTGHGRMAYSSNHGEKNVDVVAPGDSIYSTHLNHGYRSLSGTSMACPHVAGMAALLLGEEPNLTPTEVRDRIVNTSAYNSNWDGYVAAKGRVDAYNMLMNFEQGSGLGDGKSCSSSPTTKQ